MNDEIKLMLNIIKDVSDHKEGSRNGLMILSCKDYKTLYDYITNLQQEINKLTAESTEWESKCYDLQQENKIKDTNWESLKYYLEKLYYKDYIEEAISDDIDKKIKELESKGEIKGYQKDIKALQQENEDNLKCINSLKEQLESVINENQRLLKQWFENNDKTVELISEKEYYSQNFKDYKSRCEKAIKCIKKDTRWFDSEYVRVYGELCDCAGAKGDRLEVMVNPSNALNILQNGSDNNDPN